MDRWDHDKSDDNILFIIIKYYTKVFLSVTRGDRESINEIFHDGIVMIQRSMRGNR